jgi:hypothetical protein
MKVGQIFKLKVPCLDNLVGTIGVCYEEYNIGEEGAGSVIFANGEHDGFSPDEQKSYLEYLGTAPDVESYKFTDVRKLYDDFRNGIFNSVFAC